MPGPYSSNDWPIRQDLGDLAGAGGPCAIPSVVRSSSNQKDESIRRPDLVAVQLNADLSTALEYSEARRRSPRKEKVMSKSYLSWLSGDSPLALGNSTAAAADFQRPPNTDVNLWRVHVIRSRVQASSCDRLGALSQHKPTGEFAVGANYNAGVCYSDALSRFSFSDDPARATRALRARAFRHPLRRCRAPTPCFTRPAYSTGIWAIYRKQLPKPKRASLADTAGSENTP